VFARHARSNNAYKITDCVAVAACVGTRNDLELKELFDNAESFDLSFFSNNTAAEFLKHFLSTGTLQDAKVLQTRLRRLLGNATFLEAFQHSGEGSSLRCAFAFASYAFPCLLRCVFVLDLALRTLVLQPVNHPM
jgi:hypothetical protein